MTLNRYIILLISAFALLFVSFLTFAAIVYGFNLDIKPYSTSMLIVLVSYLAMMISISSYLIGRAIFVPKEAITNKYFLIGYLLLVYLVAAPISYDFYVNDKGMVAEQYAINSSILIIMFVVVPMLLARPNRFFLKLIAKIHKGF
jgi:magnesium-transporting ATPase (P-type)